MAYTRLPLATFQAKYTAFPTLTEPGYDAWATDAEGRVGENYGDDQQRATELLTAHLLAINAVGAAPGVAMLAATGATRFKSGTFDAAISDSVISRRAKGGYQATVWGQQFAEIQRALFGAPRLVGFLGTPC